RRCLLLHHPSCGAEFAEAQSRISLSGGDPERSQLRADLQDRDRWSLCLQRSGCGIECPRPLGTEVALCKALALRAQRENAAATESMARHPIQSLCGGT